MNWETKPNESEESLVSVGTITEPGRYECSLSAAHDVRENGDFYFRFEPFNNHGEILITSWENGYYFASRLEIIYASIGDSQYHSTSSNNFTFLGFGIIGIFLLLFFGVFVIIGIFLTLSLRSQRRRILGQY